ncbi:hypothetical protein QBC41DRAFT_108034 [Cercophora samala]|uniref:DUF7582 domain-containing protein n=1 Tax=Cercophora samala TaxID=330535 RepID=A0AA39ZEI9_9PEZI|nr:hypothetical protein QBC41DRAFT_108034 [Cercophora samala]
MAPIMRNRISSPLEAGPSITDSLPVYVNEALDYASKKLAKKGANITLLVVRRDYQLPTSTIVTSPTFTPGSHVLNTAPLRPSLPPVSRLEALKQFVKLNNTTSDGSVRERIVHIHLDRFSDGTVSPAFSEASAISSSTYSSVDSTFSNTSSNRFRWPGSPSHYGSGSVPMTPATPFTVMSDNSVAPSSSTQQTGMKFIHAHPLTPKDERVLSQTIEKTAKKFKLGSEWLSQPVSASSLSLPPDLIRLSLSQNQPLFTSSHLNLLSIDSLYTFRTALQAYARTRSSYRLEDAVDELRRLYLSNGRRPLLKSVLLNSYRWLDPICDHSLSQVCRMYERAYGGNVIRDDTKDASAAAWPLLAEEKEILFTLNSPTDSETEDEEDMDDEKFDLKAIEAWYRTTSIHHQPPPHRQPPRREERGREQVLRIDPLRSHPSHSPPARAHDILLPSPPPIPVRPAPIPIPEERRTTPKLCPAPPGRNPALQLKLQTTFEKRLPLPPREETHSPVSPHPSDNNNHNNNHDEEEEEEEEEHTARPQSAIKSFPPHPPPLLPPTVQKTTGATKSGNGSAPPSAQWSKTSFSLNEIMLSPDGAAGAAVGGEEAEEQRERVGPLTPNGYDDISPITRGEWGFLFPVVAERQRLVRVETCT